MPLSTHVLDTAAGTPAAGIAVTLYAVARDGTRRAVAHATTNDDGRTGAPLAETLERGTYELVFAVGAYFTARAIPSFYDDVPVRVRVDDETARYHVPLLIAPWSYATYRGS